MSRLEVQYEETVADLEAVARQLLPLRPGLGAGLPEFSSGKSPGPHRQCHAGAAAHLQAFHHALEELRKVARTALCEIAFAVAGRRLTAKVAGAAGDKHLKAARM